MTWGGDPSDTGRRGTVGAQKGFLLGLGGREGGPERPRTISRDAEEEQKLARPMAEELEWPQDNCACKGPRGGKDSARNQEGVRNEALEAGGPRSHGLQSTTLGADCRSRHMGDVCSVLSRLD